MELDKSHFVVKSEPASSGRHCQELFSRSIHPAWLWVLAGVIVCLASKGRAAVFDYSAPLQSVTASFSGSTVSFQVFDPAQGSLKAGSVTGVNTMDLTNQNGVVAFSSGSTFFYVIYDPARTNWIVGSTNTASPTFIPLRNANGVVAWSSGNSVHYRVYDSVRGSWMPGSILMASAANPDLSVANGVVAWSSGNTVYYAAYDPAAGAWRPGSKLNTSSTSDITNANGVVAWSSSTTVSARTYDPYRGLWAPSDANLGSTFDLKNGNGVVAWSLGSTIYNEIYDSIRSNWFLGQTISGSTVDLAVNGGTVTWSTASQQYTRGYNPVSGIWYAGVTMPRANFFMSTNSGNAPLSIFFVDMSIGASAWSWNFGDGGVSTQRAPLYTFRGFNNYTVTLTASGTGGSAVTNKNVTSDITAPSGTIQINGTNALVTSNQVTLKLSATDNSGVVAEMQFSNDNGPFSAWEPYATNRIWLLSTNDGTKSVYVKFRDVVGNVSAPATDTIKLDTTPPSQVFFSFSNTNVAENAGGYAVRVLLDKAFPREAAVDYTTSDGTANAGIDYTTASGRLVFQAGETIKTFNVNFNNDSLVELNETILLTLSNPSNLVVGPTATITIMDDDPPAISFSQTNYNVGEGDGGAIITVQLSPASGRTVSINYAVSNGTATAGADYSAVGGTLVFAPGQLSRSFTVPILNDTLDETNETILLYLQNPTNGVLGTLKSALLTIQDDDPPTVRFSTSLYSVSENSGNAVVTVSLSKPFSQTVFVDISTSGGSAAPGSDYVSASATLTFAPQQTSKNFQITILNDNTYETNKTFGISLSNFFNCSPGLVNATVMIQDDDATRLAAVNTNGSIQLIITGPLGQRCSLEASSSMTNWNAIDTITNQTGRTVYDAGPPKAGFRFYRALVVP
jgi:PKD repeat protein